MNCNDAQQMMMSTTFGDACARCASGAARAPDGVDVCGREWSIESELDSMLTNRLPKFEARASLRSACGAPSRCQRSRVRRVRKVVSGRARSGLGRDRRSCSRRSCGPMRAARVTIDDRPRAINDHLRIMFSEHLWSRQRRHSPGQSHGSPERWSSLRCELFGRR